MLEAGERWLAQRADQKGMAVPGMKMRNECLRIRSFFDLAEISRSWVSSFYPQSFFVVLIRAK